MDVSQFVATEDRWRMMKANELRLFWWKNLWLCSNKNCYEIWDGFNNSSL